MKKIVIIILVTYVVSILSHIVYIVPKSNYGILDQTGKVKLKSYPKLKDVSFEYNALSFFQWAFLSERSAVW